MTVEEINVLIGVGSAIGGATLVITGTLIKLYGDVRVLKSSEGKQEEYIKESEEARHQVVTQVAEMKTDIEYIKKDAEKNDKFRALVYEYMINPIKKQA